MSGQPSLSELAGWGASLREIDPASLSKDDDGAQVRWFMGDNGTELFAWSHPPAAPHHLQLVFARVSVEWDQERGLVTGSFKSGSTSSGGRYDPYLLSVGARADLEVCRSALSLLRAAKVDAPLLAPLIGALERAGAPAPGPP